MIDVWDVETFDNGLIAELHASAELVRSYIETDQTNFLHKDTSSGVRAAYRDNPYEKSYLDLLEALSCTIETRIIRAWHYTRLTDGEVETLRATGVYPSTLETTRQRINALVDDGLMSSELATEIFEASPLHDSAQVLARSNKFWMTSHPIEASDGGVSSLLSNWGGEAVYFWLDTHPHLAEFVAGIGKPRVLEIAVPVDATRQAHFAAKSIVATFAETLECVPNFREFDLFSSRALGSEAILSVHTEGESAFRRIARGYPSKFRPFEQ